MNFKLPHIDFKHIFSLTRKERGPATPLLKNNQPVLIASEIILVDQNHQQVHISDGHAILVKSVVTGESRLRPGEVTKVAFFAVKGTSGRAPYEYWESLILAGKVKVL